MIPLLMMTGTDFSPRHDRDTRGIGDSYNHKPVTFNPSTCPLEETS
jgi:hypothetical protein